MLPNTKIEEERVSRVVGQAEILSNPRPDFLLPMNTLALTLKTECRAKETSVSRKKLQSTFISPSWIRPKPLSFPQEGNSQLMPLNVEGNRNSSWINHLDQLDIKGKSLLKWWMQIYTSPIHSTKLSFTIPNPSTTQLRMQRSLYTKGIRIKTHVLHLNCNPNSLSLSMHWAKLSPKQKVLQEI